MRMLNIRLPASFRSNNADVSLSSPDMTDMLVQELEGMRLDLEQAMRTRLSTYFPGDFEITVRFQFIGPRAAMRVSIWVFDPNIRWPAGLLARRAWNLSVPILVHVTEEVFSERLENVELVIDRNKTRVTAFAPTRFWKDPVVVMIAALLAASLYWNFVHPSLLSYLQSVLGR